MEELPFSNEGSYRRYLKIADKIEADPALLDRSVENIAGWLVEGHSGAHRLIQWRDIILKARTSSQGMTALLALLRDNSEEAQHLKSFSPITGILTRQERREVTGNCIYAH